MPDAQLNARRRAILAADKGEIAALENYGKQTGDYGQITQVMLDDLDQRGGFIPQRKADVLADPDAYDVSVQGYWDLMGKKFGIPHDERAMWWLSPGQYKKTDGDISKVGAFGPYNEDEARNVFSNRYRNRAIYRTRRENENTAESLGGESSDSLGG